MPNSRGLSRPAADFSLYLVTDRGLSRGRATGDIVREAVAGGVSCMQLLEKKQK